MQLDKIRKISTVGTVICIIAVVIYIISAMLLLFGIDSLMEFVNDSMNNMADIDSNSPSAGFEVIAYLAGGGLGFIGGLFAFLFAFICGILAVYQIPAIFSGLIANSKYKKNNAEAKCIGYYKTDGYIKTIMNGIVVLLTIFLLLSDIRAASIMDILGLLVAAWNFIVVFVLGIVQIRCIRKNVQK